MLMSFTPVPPGAPVGGLHKHSNAYTTIVLAGTPKHGPSPEEAVSFSAGGYWNQPGNEAHYDVCEGTEPCVILTYWTDIRDFFPVEEKDSTVAWKGVLADQVVWEKGSSKKSQIAVASGDPKAGPFVQLTKCFWI
jgi:gentisate 1,2-dioxygenase